jgi:hypothetical protein
MRHCALPACLQPAVARGWCSGHYTRWLRAGDVRASEPLLSRPHLDACAVAGCTDPTYARDWCQMHYKRWRRHGSVQAGKPKRGGAQRLCDVDGCARPHDARGLCHGHYLRWVRTGDVAADLPLGRRRQPEHCTVEFQGKACGRASHSQGLCRAHHQRLRKHGDVLANIPIRSAQGEGCISHGYVKVPVPKALRHLTNGDTGVGEHRLVMAMHLGRPLRADEVVHHVNGDRTDNRLENLELWSTAHPKGQRIDDKIDFALTMLRRYAPAMLADVLQDGASGVGLQEEWDAVEVEAPTGFEPALPP